MSISNSSTSAPSVRGLLFVASALLAALSIFRIDPLLQSFRSPESTEAEKASIRRREQERSNVENADKDDNQRLNILLLYADDWSYETLHATGNTFVKTPYLDRMVQNGMVFTHNCVTTSICMVSRATLYTGQYASRHQTFYSYRDLHMYEDGNWNVTLYQVLRQHGYYVGFFGKYHHHEGLPSKTFDEWKVYHGSHYIDRWGISKHITQWNEEDGMEFLQNRPKDQPFALTISFFATHAEDGSEEQYRPMNSSMHWYADETVPNPKTHTEKHWNDMPYFFGEQNFGRARYMKRYSTPELYQHHMKNTYRMATEVDAACGRLIEELERQDLLDNTLVIFTTDNGNFHGQHGLAEKWYAYEEALRVPLIMMDPRMPDEMIGTSNDEFTLNIDLAPTILSAANIPVPSVMQGRDMAALYLDAERARESWRKEFFYEWWGEPFALPSNFALVRKDMKYMIWSDFGYEQLYDLKADPFEEEDLFGDELKNGQLLEMRKKMLELQEMAGSGFLM